jgi:hypothetical protein
MENNYCCQYFGELLFVTSHRAFIVAGRDSLCNNRLVWHDIWQNTLHNLGRRFVDTACA